MKSKVKFLVSCLVLALSLSFIGISASTVEVTGNCLNCGSFQGYYEGDSYLNCGYASCEIVPGWPPCEVDGYGICSGAPGDCMPVE